MQLCFGQVMPAAIHLDDEARLMKSEVGDILADRSLPTDMQTDPAQRFPERLFRQGHFAPKPAPSIHRALAVPFSV